MGNATDKWKSYMNVAGRVAAAEQKSMPKPKPKPKPKAPASGTGVPGVKVDPKYANARQAAIDAARQADLAAIAAKQGK